MTPFNETAARGLCESLARRLPVDRILREGRPYLDRFYVAGWSPTNKQRGPAVFLHRFVASDPEGMHSHPWAFAASVILVGGYLEERCLASGNGEVERRTFRPGDVNVLSPTDRHRVTLLAPVCWTLFLAGDYQQPWNFSPTC